MVLWRAGDGGVFGPVPGLCGPALVALAAGAGVAGIGVRIVPVDGEFFCVCVSGNCFEYAAMIPFEGNEQRRQPKRASWFEE